MDRKVKVGATFGKLKVIAETNMRLRGAKLWSCVCECGINLFVKTDYLQQGWTKSCGCLRAEKAKNRLPELHRKRFPETAQVYKINLLIRNTKGNAKKRGLEYSLSDLEVFEITNQPCHYCRRHVFVGIDRKNNSAGYTKENSLPCCKICNRAKNNMTYEDFTDYISAIRKN